MSTDFAQWLLVALLALWLIRTTGRLHLAEGVIRLLVAAATEEEEIPEFVAAQREAGAEGRQ